MKRCFGCWTPKGRLYYESWNNFKKYLTDPAALKRYPPESIKIWDHCLVYATAMGVAKECLHNMSPVISSEDLKGSRFCLVHSSYVQFGSGFGHAHTLSSPAGRGGGGSGGVGGTGGGFGGGGEGAH